jgi:hypothetical protein
MLCNAVVALNTRARGLKAILEDNVGYDSAGVHYQQEGDDEQ